MSKAKGKKKPTEKKDDTTQDRQADTTLAPDEASETESLETAEKKEDSTENAPTVTTITVTAAAKLRVRKSPGMSGIDTGLFVRNGDVLEVLGTQSVDGIKWYQIDTGWVHGDYAKEVD